MDKRLLQILRCPVSGQTLTPMTATQIESINQAIAQGRTQADGATPPPFRQGLMTANQDRAYRIEDGIPILLVSESIALGTD